MNRLALIGALPGNFQALSVEEQRRVAENFVESIAFAVRDEGRELDDWEARDLMYACSAMFSRMYTLSVVASKRALALPSQRAGSWPRTDETPDIERVLRTLDAVRSLRRTSEPT